VSAQPLGLSFDPSRPVARPLDAATVLVLRAGVTLEVYCVQRHAKSPFLGGAIVFPGGKVDASDADPSFANLSGDARAFDLGRDDPRPLLVAAARELVEEAGLLPAPVGAEIAASVRKALKEGAPFGQALGVAGVVLNTPALIPFARWVTPEAEPRRFDARFFMLELPAGQEARPDEHETTLGFWAAPAEVLERFHAGSIQLAPPTTRSLEILAAAESVAHAISIARQQDLRPVCPKFVAGDPPFLALPGDPTHDVTERIVSGPTRFVMRDGRLVSEDPPA
jgi:8-oxo-dGTP pyrophosphatase MutT (NUDIX family)